MTASLAEGKIKVDIRSSHETFILDPDEQVVFDKNTGVSERKRARMDYVLGKRTDDFPECLFVFRYKRD